MDKRIVIICGHYGSGKTNIAVNLALDAAKSGKAVTLADLDIVNPYFRAKDSEAELKAAGVRFICSKYANSNLDIPALPPEIYDIIYSKDRMFILDIGGDDMGATVLGRLSSDIVKENNYEMVFVINKYRPLTADAAASAQIMREIEAACNIPFTAIINNSNLGAETTPETVADSAEYANEVSKATGLPLLMTSVDKKLFEDVRERIINPYPLALQKKI